MSKDFLAGLTKARAKRQKLEGDTLLAPWRRGDFESKEDEKQTAWQGPHETR